MNGAPHLLLLVSKVLHRRKKEGDANLMRPNIGDLFDTLGHPDTVGVAIEVLENSRFKIQLITEHQNRVSHITPSARYLHGAAMQSVQDQSGLHQPLDLL